MWWQSGYTINVLKSTEAIKKNTTGSHNLNVFPNISFSVAYLNDLKFFKEFPSVNSAPYSCPLCAPHEIKEHHTSIVILGCLS